MKVSKKVAFAIMVLSLFLLTSTAGQAGDRATEKDKTLQTISSASLPAH